MTERILNVKVGEPLAASLALASMTMEALEQGKPVVPYFGIGFADVGQLFAVFTPKRWDLLAALREAGPMTIAELARRVRRDYKNVHGDVEKLIEWRAVDRMNTDFPTAPLAPGHRGAGGGTVEKSLSASHTEILTLPYCSVVDRMSVPPM